MLTVMKNCHVRFSPDKNYYSVTFRFIGEKVNLAVSCHDVEIFLGNQRIALHKRSRNPHQYTSVKDHLPSSHQFVSEMFFHFMEPMEPLCNVSPCQYVVYGVVASYLWNH